MSEIQELKARAEQLKKDISRYKNLQLAKKVQLNSAYGALGNEYFRFFDVRQAEAITSSGQLSIRWIEVRLNEYLNKTFNTEEYDYVVAVDTDSVYLRFGDVLNNTTSNERRVNNFDKIAKEILEPFINQSYQELAKRMNAFDQKMHMKREVIASKGIWTAKKRYILNVHDSEGVRYEEPKLKMMGIETVRSSTPAACRDALKKALKIIMNEDEESVQIFIKEFKTKFKTLPFEDIAFPRTVSDMEKYFVNSNKLVIPKGTPIHVRGSLTYNFLLKEHKLEREYEIIKSGEKIKFCYLKEPNFTRDNVISSIGTLPSEFDLDKHIDFELQFTKTFLEPLKNILDVIGWEAEKQARLF